MSPEMSRRPINIEPVVLRDQGAELGLMGEETRRIMEKAREAEYSTSSGSRFSSLESLGISPGLVRTSDCYLYLVVLDDSGSILKANADDDVRDAYNGFIEKIKEAKESGLIRSDILVAVAGLNAGVIRPYCRIQDATPLSDYDYRASDEYGTPLFDVTVQAHSLQMSKVTELALHGITARTATMIITDGEDSGSHLSASDVASVVTDLVHDRHHVIEGIYRGACRKSTFREMAIPDEWIRSGGESMEELLNEFVRFSQSSMSEFEGGAHKRTDVTIG